MRGHYTALVGIMIITAIPALGLVALVGWALRSMGVTVHNETQSGLIGCAVLIPCWLVSFFAARWITMWYMRRKHDRENRLGYWERRK